MELAGVVLGALPVLVETLKAWKTVHQKFRIFRHYAKEVRRIHDKLQVQQCVFENEIEVLLVTTGVSPSEAQDMLADLGHPHWNFDTTDRNIVKYLTKNADVYQDLVSSIASSINRIERELKVFDCITLQRRTSERLKETVLRLKSAVGITFTKTEYEKEVDSLRQDIADLRAIGSHRKSSAKLQLQQRRAIASYELPASTPQIRDACNALYQALDGCWSCANKEHAGHAAKLCLKARVEDCVRLDLALACNPIQGSVPEPLWLHVRSLTQVCPKQSLQQKSAASVAIIPEQSPSRVKRTKIVNDTALLTGRDLQSSPSLCDSLAQCHCLTQSEECLGYVDSQTQGIVASRLRHHFYHRCERDNPRTITMTELQVPTVLESTSVSIEYQLRLAYAIATSVLQLYNTPWMRNEWRLGDVSLFQACSQDVLAPLDTLHLTTKFEQSRDMACTAAARPIVSKASSLESSDCSDEQCLYGVPNLMLFSLGVALLEISHQQSLEKFRNPRDPNNTYTARRLAQQPSSLGRKYQIIAQRCLQCDFGCGSELSKAPLQTAVYNDVVCQLGDMLKAFAI